MSDRVGYNLGSSGGIPEKPSWLSEVERGEIRARERARRDMEVLETAWVALVEYSHRHELIFPFGENFIRPMMDDARAKAAFDSVQWIASEHAKAKAELEKLESLAYGRAGRSVRSSTAPTIRGLRVSGLRTSVG